MVRVWYPAKQDPILNCPALGQDPEDQCGLNRGKGSSVRGGWGGVPIQEVAPPPAAVSPPRPYHPLPVPGSLWVSGMLPALPGN